MIDGAPRPVVSADAAECIREWHETAQRMRIADSALGQTFTYLGKTLVVPPKVHPITGMSHLLGEAVLAEVQQGDRVLDMGTGSGVNAILAASRGAQVVAVDISPEAVDAARENAVRSGFADRIEVHRSDVFTEVVGEFDVIVYNPPFRWFASRHLPKAPGSDENGRAVTMFFRTARQYLTLTGRMLIFFGTWGDAVCLQQLADGEGFTTALIAQEDLIKDGWRVDYLAFRVTLQ